MIKPLVGDNGNAADAVPNGGVGVVFPIGLEPGTPITPMGFRLSTLCEVNVGSVPAPAIPADPVISIDGGGVVAAPEAEVVLLSVLAVIVILAACGTVAVDVEGGHTCPCVVVGIERGIDVGAVDVGVSFLSEVCCC